MAVSSDSRSTGNVHDGVVGPQSVVSNEGREEQSDALRKRKKGKVRGHVEIVVVVVVAAVVFIKLTS